MIGAVLAPWVAVGIGSTTFVVYLGLRIRNTPEQDASGLALLAGSVVLLTLQTLGVV